MTTSQTKLRMKKKILRYTLLTVAVIPCLVLLAYFVFFISFFLVFKAPFLGSVFSYEGYCSYKPLPIYETVASIETILLIVIVSFALLNPLFQLRNRSRIIFHIINTLFISNLIYLTCFIVLHPILINTTAEGWDGGSMGVGYSNPLIYVVIFFSGDILIRTYRFYRDRKESYAAYLIVVSVLIVLLVSVSFWALNNSITYERCAG